MKNETAIGFDLLSIDAWKDENEWYWNNQFYLEREIYFLESELTNRKILRWLRDKGFLSEQSKGRVEIENIAQGDYCFEIRAKGTKEPIFALSAIH